MEMKYKVQSTKYKVGALSPLYFVLCTFHFVLCTSFASAQKDKVGPLSPDIFRKEAPLKKWFVKGYDKYQPDAEAIKKLKTYLADKKIVVVLGTWCSDSEEQFPRLMKVLDAAGFPKQQLMIYGINEKKTVPQNIVAQYKITLVPTIILFNKDGKERGRITEEPKARIEEDLLSLK
jgi:thiol-disulfide isomerase/thioredoxin